LLLAERLGGEIVSVDSMQVYRGMDIGTAKPSLAERARVPHHLIDILQLTESFEVATFLKLAQEAIATIKGRGKVPIFCGGSGLYFQAYLEGLGQAPAWEPDLRAQLEKLTLPALLQELAQADPLTYERIDHANARRVIRAVEVIRLTGRPLSEQQAAWGRGRRPAKQPSEEPAFFVLQRTPEDLWKRIDQRVDAMFAAGLMEEVRTLLGRGLAQNRTASQALGYRQVLEFLQGARSLEATVSLVKQRTRKYAKRQLTWFRQQPQAQWAPCLEAQPLENLAAYLVERYNSS
jgi:tRNA dimethylallyltransferase